MIKLSQSLAFKLSYEKDYGMVNEREKDLVSDLRSVGLDVFTSQQLRDTTDVYPEAIPILIKYLSLTKDEGVIDTIIRSLTVKEAVGLAFDPIYEMYLKEKDTTLYGVKASMANALSHLAEKKDITKLKELLIDKSHGFTRIYFIDKIVKSANKDNIIEIKNILMDLEHDDIEGIRNIVTKALKKKKFQD